MFVRIAAGAVAGIDAVTVSVEVNVAAAGQLGLFLVGLPDNAVKESEQRIRSAFENTGLRMTGKKLVVNLAPADLRKEGAGFDLPIAVGILAATEQVPAEALDGTMLAGELSLDGTLKPVRGILPMAVKAREEGLRRLIVPCDNACEAAVVEGVEVIGAASLGETVEYLRGDRTIAPAAAPAAFAEAPSSEPRSGGVHAAEGSAPNVSRNDAIYRVPKRVDVAGTHRGRTPSGSALCLHSESGITCGTCRGRPSTWRSGRCCRPGRGRRRCSSRPRGSSGRR